jgi:RHS repeat-associated protein
MISRYKRLRIRRSSWVVLAVALALAALPAAASASSDFNGNSCTSSTFCMVVGSTGPSGSSQILIEKWNGSAWSKSSYSNPSGATESRLNAVACRTTTECRAVGSYVDASKVTHLLTMAWNGTTWSTVSAPEPTGATLSRLSGISCPATTDCEAVGTYTDSAGVEKTLALRWNGSAWSVATTGNPVGTGARLNAVSCTSTSDCRAVGTYVTTGGANRSFAMAWNGTAWSLVSSPVPAGATASQLLGVSCVSTSLCHAVGSYTESGTVKTLAITWNGTAWSVTASPNPAGSSETKLASISCVSTTSCSALGSSNDGGSQSFPLAMAWNGTAWSQAAVDSESFAAQTASFASVSCPSSSFCHGVGSLTYGKSAANRAFAYSLSGGKWGVVGADGYQREWSAVELPAPGGEDTAAKADVACASASFCMRVGASLNGSTPTSRAKTWNGGSWTKSTTVSPAGAKASELGGVACASTTACRAVGSYVDSTGVTKPLTLAWNGTAWSVTTTPVPAGATSSRLTAIACLSSTDCRAVGSYVASGTTRTLAMSWNGTAWSIVATPNAVGPSNQLLGVACTAASSCRAVGSYTEAGGTVKTLAMNWNGTAWSIATSGNPSGAKESALLDLSCTSATFCIAVGYSVNSESKKQIMAQRLSGSSWTITSFEGTLPTFPTSEFTGVACVAPETSATECRAVGRSAEGSGASETESSFIANRREKFGVSFWEPKEAVEAPAADRAGLSAVACPANFLCVAVGRAKYKTLPWEDMGNRWTENGGFKWTLDDPPGTNAVPLNGVACPNSNLCISVGTKQVGSSTDHRAWKKEGEAWSPMTLPTVANSQLNAVDCTDSTHCTAVGKQGQRTLAERWNGTSWSVQTTADPEAIFSVGLASVDCPTVSNCMAVGYRQTSEPGPSLAAFSEEWNGSTWTIRKVPRRAGATESYLRSVSCSSASFCVAVGYWDDETAAPKWPTHPLVEHWDGTAWRVVAAPEPPELEAGEPANLSTVSCSSSTACTAVGYSGSTPYSIRWNGTSWSLNSPPDNVRGLDCVSSNKCISGGTEGSSPRMGGWDGTVWQRDNLSSLALSSKVEAVSCTRAVDCVAVGESWTSGLGGHRGFEFALKSSEAANQEVPDTTILSGPTGTVASAKQTFNFASSEAGGGYECSLDGAAYTACAPPKAYTLANGSHTFKVRATDIAGNVDATPAERTFTVSQPPQTTITSATPSYTSEQTWPVTFSSDIAGATFQCKLDNGSFSACSSPYTLPALSATWHTFEVRATAGGLTDTSPARWEFNQAIYPKALPANQVTSPTAGQKSPSHFTLKAKWAEEGITGVTFQVRAWTAPKFVTIPAQFVLNGKGEQVTWPLKVSGSSGETEPLFFDAYAYSKSIAPSETLGETTYIRAVFDGSAWAAGASEPVGVQYDRRGSSQDAREQVGPAQLDLLTGGYTISRTDVSIPIPGAGANLEFGRVYDSQYFGQGTVTKVLGGNWQPSVPVSREESAGSWRQVYVDEFPAEPAVVDPETGEILEEALPAEKWAEVVTAGGDAVEFDYDFGKEKYIPVDYAREIQLAVQANAATVTEPNGDRTVFEKHGEGLGASHSWWEYEAQTSSVQASPRVARMVYKTVGSEQRLSMIIAPSAPGVTCQENSNLPNYAVTTPGCRSLIFHYSEGHQFPMSDDRLTLITYEHPTLSGSEVLPQSDEVAQYAYAKTSFNVEQLAEVWDPRISPNLKEKYEYTSGGYALAKLTPPGEEPWTFTYTASSEGRVAGGLRTVSRATLLSEPSKATTTIAYDVPLSGSKAPYDMSPSSVAKWGQKDFPVYAAAIYPPTEVPTSFPPSGYTKASIKYLDPDGYLVNTASPQLPGASGPSINTSEVDETGNTVRTLGAQARLTALEDPNPAERSHELATKRIYNTDGTELLEEYGPLHEIRLESGGTVEARAHTSLKYNEGITAEAEPYKPHLVTTATTGARIPGQPADLETRVTKTEYDWKWLKPSAEITDPSGLNLRTTYLYDGTTGLLTERRLPGTPGGGNARTTKTIYYSQGANSEYPECGGKPQWANLPCKTLPAAQPTPAESNPGLPITTITSYSAFDQPTEIKETTGGVLQRTTTKTYDSAGRPIKTKVTGGGVSIPASETLYSSATGRPTTQRFVCEAESCIGFDNQATTTTYNTIGQPYIYEDADGNKSSTTYDLMGRPVTVSDGKGTQTYTYDSTTGVATQIVDSAAGTFTAAYNADGQITAGGLPNGLTAEMTYDETGSPIHRRYQKTTACSSNCTWLDFGVEESIRGQWLKETSNGESNEYSYDKAGRITLVKERPEGAGCTTRSYAFDADSNRTKSTTRSPGTGGACDTTSTGIVQNYSYDTGDRLIGGGVTYDNLGRITSLPEAYAGGGTLTTSYYVNNLVRSQTQGGLTNTYELDSSLRQRKVTLSGAETGSSTLHYAGPSDSPAWIDEVGKWTRNVAGFEGLAAIQESSGTTTLMLTDLHGDVVGTASLETGATEPLSSLKYDEFGNPKQANGPRYGWLGGKGRRTELSSGVIQMGVRSYVPAMGRFLTPDPVLGGSANAYDYAMQDPIGNMDLDGKVCHDFKTHISSTRVSFYLQKKCTRELYRSLVKTRRGKKVWVGALAIEAAACSVLAFLPPPGQVAAVACGAIMYYKMEEFKIELEYAFDTYRCLTFTIPNPGTYMFDPTVPHFGASKRPKWCPKL